MLDSDTAIIATAIAVPTATVTAIVLRGAFAKAAIQKALQSARPDVEKFKQDNDPFIYLPDEIRPIAQVLLETIQASKEMRASVINTMRAMSNLDGKMPENFSEIQLDLKNQSDVFLSSLKGTAKYKIKHIAKSKIKDRLLQARNHAAGKMDDIAGTATVAIGSNTDILGDMAGDAAGNFDISNHASDFDALEQVVSDFMDQIGVIDAVEHVAHALNDKLHDIFSDSVADWVAEKGADAFLIISGPAVYSSIKASHREIKMLWNGETDFEDAFINGALPQIARYLAIGMGAAVDAATGGISMGLFATLASYAASKITGELITEQNRSLIGEFNALAKNISDGYKKAVETINVTVSKFKKNFTAQVESCPNINDDIILKSFIDELLESYNQDLEIATSEIIKKVQKKIMDLPDNNWTDKILFIDRRKAVGNLYSNVQREFTSKGLGVLNEFSRTAETDAEEAITFLMQHLIFKESKTLVALKDLEQTTVDAAENYKTTLTDWEDGTKIFWNRESAQVSDVIKTETAQYNEMAKDRKSSMQKVKRRINANYTRLGLKDHIPAEPSVE